MPDKLRISTNENFRQTKRWAGDLITPAGFAALRLFTREFYRRRHALLRRRVRTGRILDCHGDLRCEHVHLGPQRPSIYDCIEFNDRLRFVDVASDVAFLAMDLHARDRPDLARRLEERLARLTHDADMLLLLPFYRCYRALVRAKVESFRSEQLGVAGRAPARERARSQFALALSYAACGTEPLVLVAMGSIATGKSTLAAQLGAAFGWPVYSSDVARKSLAGVSPGRRTPRRLRSRLYTRAMSRRIYRLLGVQAGKHARQHASCILDATFSERRERSLLRARIARAGGRVLFVELKSTLAAIKRRLRLRGEGAVSDARLEDLPAALARYQPPGELTPDQHLRVRTEDTPDRTLKTVLRRLVQKQLKRPIPQSSRRRSGVAKSRKKSSTVS